MKNEREKEGEEKVMVNEHRDTNFSCGQCNYSQNVQDGHVGCVRISDFSSDASA